MLRRFGVHMASDAAFVGTLLLWATLLLQENRPSRLSGIVNIAVLAIAAAVQFPLALASGDLARGAWAFVVLVVAWTPCALVAPFWRAGFLRVLMLAIATVVGASNSVALRQHGLSLPVAIAVACPVVAAIAWASYNRKTI